jgi:uncharacterized protein (TIGR04540 family)
LKTVEVATNIRDELTKFLSRQIEEQALVEVIEEYIKQYPEKIFLRDGYTATFKQRLGIQRIEEFERIYEIIKPKPTDKEGA